MKNLLALALPFALLVAACGKKDESKAASPSAAPADPSKIQIAVTEDGFQPESVEVPAGKPVTLVFTRKTDQTCAKEVVLTMDDGKKIEKQLPLDTPVELAATFPKAGKLGYACGMDMVKGVIVVR
jgi:plastocyanin domain-containing protein